MRPPKSSKSDPFRLLPGGHSTGLPDPTCQVAAQAVMAGQQDYRVTGANAQMTGRGHGVISLRVGRVLLHLEDRAALESWSRAVDTALALQDAAFGPILPPVRITAEPA